jgi:hypothetical protein
MSNIKLVLWTITARAGALHNAFERLARCGSELFAGAEEKAIDPDAADNRAQI